MAVEHGDDCEYLGGVVVLCRCRSDGAAKRMAETAELAEKRGSLSLAAQVIYQCKVLEILREEGERAPRLLSDPVALQREYERRHGRHG